MKGRKRAKYIVRVLIVFLAAVLCGVIAVLADADLYIRLFQTAGMVSGQPNKWEEAPAESSLEDHIILRSGIRYGNTYPNSFLDVYTSENDTGDRPVYIFIHGGGYAWGDKYDGDPLGTGENGAAGMTENLVKIAENGYNVVSVNYALVPEYRYPVPLIQINEAVDFLRENAETYGLDMSRIVLSGASAGGQLAGQYAAIVTDEEYAEEMGIDPAVGKDDLAGIVFRCALLEPENFDEVDTLYFKLMFRQLKKGYFGDSEDILTQADVIGHVTEDFPPVYITDGNHGTFDAQAQRLHQRLDELHVYNVLNYYPPEEARLEHGYDSDLNNEYARDNLEQELQFLADIK